MKSEKSRERKAQKITAATAASQKYIYTYFLAFFWLPRTLPKANNSWTAAQLETYVCAAGGGVAAIVQLVSCEFWAKFWENATVLSVLHVALESRRQLVTHAACGMGGGWQQGPQCQSNVRHARDAPQSSRCARIGFDDFTNCLKVKAWDKAKSNQINAQVVNENRELWIKKLGILN